MDPWNDHRADVGVLDNFREQTSLASSKLATDEAAHLKIFQRFVADGTRILVRVAGEVDLTTAPVLADALELARSVAARMPDFIAIEVDLRAVEFLSAAGLTVIVRAHRRCDHDAVPLHVVAGHSAVTRPLRLTGLDQVLGLRAVPDSHSLTLLSSDQP